MALNTSSKSCEVCGSTSIQHDEVFDRGRLILSECDRCQHRWTRAHPISAARKVVRVRRVSPGEVAMAS
jgi:hypothetical protein